MTYLRRRGLLLQRLAEISCPLAQLVQQPRILDGNDGLGREAFGESNLLIYEGSDFLAINGDGTNQLVML